MRLFAVVISTLFLGCSLMSKQAQQTTTAAPEGNRAHDIELTIKDIDADLLAQLQKNMQQVPELKSAQLKSHSGKTAVISLQYPGDLEDLPDSLGKVPHPGLRFSSANYKVEFSAFDNEPPKVAFVFPDNEQIVTTREQFITVEVPDKDLASVDINNTPAPLYKGSIYRLKMNLNEGRQELVATAKDKAGNQSSAKVAVVVDTTPPALNAQVRLVVEGNVEPGSSVLINGQEIAVDGDGHYKAEVPVRRGQKTVEIVAIDKNGNKTVNRKDIGI